MMLLVSTGSVKVQIKEDAMQQDKLQKQARRPGGNGSLDISDLTDEIPEVDNVLDEVNKAIERAKRLKNKLTTRRKPVERNSCRC